MKHTHTHTHSYSRHTHAHATHIFRWTSLRAGRERAQFNGLTDWLTIMHSPLHDIFSSLTRFMRVLRVCARVCENVSHVSLNSFPVNHVIAMLASAEWKMGENEWKWWISCVRVQGTIAMYRARTHIGTNKAQSASSSVQFVRIACGAIQKRNHIQKNERKAKWVREVKCKYASTANNSSMRARSWADWRM